MPVNPVERHYGREGIAERVLAALRAADGPHVPVTVDALAPIDHFHGRGVFATEELVELLDPQPASRFSISVRGIGGPARWIAAKRGVHVDGVDLTPEFCAAARADRGGRAGRPGFDHEGSALALPVPDGAFDCAYSQNVVMNIADKLGIYREAFRALRPGGMLALSNFCAGAGRRVPFPVPWADDGGDEFPRDAGGDARRPSSRPGSRSSSFRDTADEPAAATARGPTREPGAPAIGIHIIMGERIREMRINSARNTEEGRGQTIEALARKPG